MQDLNQKPNNPNVNKWRLASLAMDMGFIIALPLVALGLLGKYLDGKFGTEPWITLAGILIAIVTTTIWLTKKFKSFIPK
ncbi:MAG TPA: AtpZ/AtpI family protein [Candidatus Binatia bacterium]|nr:AtpZ/AtpI family protein [Candidatus Binatia bacterium]